MRFHYLVCCKLKEEQIQQYKLYLFLGMLQVNHMRMAYAPAKPPLNVV